MKKLLLSALFMLALCHLSFGQKIGKTKFSIGPELGVAAQNPLKSLPGNKGWGLGIGASGQVEHFFRESMTGLVSFGIISYAGRASGSNTNNKAYTAIPVRIGTNFYAGNRFHAGAQVGVGINSMGGTGSTAFSYSPQIGYSFSRNEKPLDLTIKYDGYAAKYNFGAWGLRLSLIL